jgi:hypothetical protein
MDRQTGRLAGRQADRQTNRQIVWRDDRQAGWQTGRYTSRFVLFLLNNFTHFLKKKFLI